MRKHAHEALIKEWLDTGMPDVEWFDSTDGCWTLDSGHHYWAETQEYRLVYPPKPKRQIKMLCYYDTVTEKLLWSSADCISGDWKRVPDLDKNIEVEE